HHAVAAIDALTSTLAALQQQCELLRQEVRASQDALRQMTLRESQLRAIVRRDCEMEAFQDELDANLARRSEIGSHVARSIASAELRLDPFPHAIVDNLLPGFLYRSLLKGIPPVELFADKPPNKQQLLVPFVLAPAYSCKVWR